MCRELSCGKHRQSGAVILFVVVVLLLISTISTLTLGKVTLSEQKQSGTDVRGKEVYSSAVGGMDFAVDWYRELFDHLDTGDGSSQSDYLWSDADGDGDFEAGDVLVNADGSALDLSGAIGNADSQADDYVRTISYQLLNDQPSGDQRMAMMVRVTVTATAVGDSHITKTVSQDIIHYPVYPFNGTPTPIGPPLIVKECTTGITGNPEIHPGPDGLAMGTTRVTGSAGATDACLDKGHIDIHGGSKKTTGTGASVFSTIFGDDFDEGMLRQLEAAAPDRVFYVDSTYPHYTGQPDFNNNNWHASVGTADVPVILYFDSSVGCPNINGSPLIYGVVYYEDSSPACSFNGWGGAEIHGTVAIEGHANNFSANGEIYGTDLDFGGGDDGVGCKGNSCLALISTVPGSWKDY